mgnify:FL=1|tara:strand:- start:4452 stop:4760 length:309 start_codon:yes stop_codon:yes gene_type:complete
MVTVIDPTNGESVEFDIDFNDVGNQRVEAKASNGDTLYLDVTYGLVPTEPMYQDRDWLLTEYADKARTMAGIAQQFDVTPMTIYAWLKKHAIPTRSRGRKSI